MIKNKTVTITGFMNAVYQLFSMKNIGKRILPYFSLCLVFSANYSTAQDLIILRGNIDYPPDEMHIDGKLTGFNIELIENVAASIPISVEFKSFPWKRAVNMLINGEGDAISYLSKNPDREKFALFLEGNIQSQTNYHFVINRARQQEIQYRGDLKKLSHYSIGLQRGYDYGEKFKQEKDIKKVEFNTLDQMKNSLQTNRIDIAIITMEEYLERKDNEFSDISILYPALDSNISYLAFSKRRNKHRFAEQFAAAMQAYKNSADYLALKKKYNK